MGNERTWTRALCAAAILTALTGCGANNTDTQAAAAESAAVTADTESQQTQAAAAKTTADTSAADGTAADSTTADAAAKTATDSAAAEPDKSTADKASASETKTTPAKTSTAASTANAQADLAEEPDDLGGDNEVTEFLEVYQSYDMDIGKTAMYFVENEADFSDLLREVFAGNLAVEYVNKLQALQPMDLTADYSYGGVGKYTEVGYIYPFYRLENSTLNYADLSTADQKLVDQAKQDSVFALYKSFWASDGAVTDSGFEISVAPDYIPAMQKIIGIAQDIQSIGSEEGYVPTDVYDRTEDAYDSSMSSATYPVVQIASATELELFENENVWKTNVLLPVSIVH